MKKIDVTKITSSQIKDELSRTKYRSKWYSFLKSTIYVLIIIFALGIIISTFFMPILQVNTKSMVPTYNQGDIVAAIKTNDLECGDIIAFYHGNKIIVSRVVGVQGDWVDIDDKGNVFINNKELKEDYVSNKKFVLDELKYPYQVGADSYFVLNDDRENVIDSRSKEVGVISKDDLIGRIIFRIYKGD